MWKNIAAIAQTFTSFLRSDMAPPNTPADQIEELKSKNHLSSKKFFIAFSAFIILGIFYAASVFILFLMAALPELLAHYVVIFTKTIEVFAIIMATYLGLQAAIDFKYSSSSNSNVNIQRTDSVDTKIVANVKDDDYELK